MTRIKTNLTSRELAKLFLEFARENKLESKIQANILNYNETFRDYDLPTAIYNITNVNPRIVDSLFIWSITPERHLYWRKVQTKWLKYLKEKSKDKKPGRSKIQPLKYTSRQTNLKYNQTNKNNTNIWIILLS